MKRTPLAPGPGPKRKKGLCAQSRAARRQKAIQVKAYAAAEDAEQCWCSACGKPGPTDHSHHFSQHQQSHLKNNPLNWLKMGRWCECHREYENNKLLFAKKYPAVWLEIISQMQRIDFKAYGFYAAKWPELYPIFDVKS